MALRRGEIRTVSGGAYAMKPRPAIIIQDDAFHRFDSVTLIPCTTNPTSAPAIRPGLLPSPGNGLRSDCRAMIDKTTTVPRADRGTRIGTLAEDDMLRISRALVLFLGIG
ncbi:type II toxin-antitoxin system PemK/MazF family toxin [Dankookia sp. P2]|uniref:type II toxin-antitoxin system PemK/MazF family toxin n=1 Tax=Dankookia sp. P2 TaxID=3423955 RepID=UPI003D67F503